VTISLRSRVGSPHRRHRQQRQQRLGRGGQQWHDADIRRHVAGGRTSRSLNPRATLLARDTNKQAFSAARQARFRNSATIGPSRSAVSPAGHAVCPCSCSPLNCPPPDTRLFTPPEMMPHSRNEHDTTVLIIKDLRRVHHCANRAQVDPVPPWQSRHTLSRPTTPPWTGSEVTGSRLRTTLRCQTIDERERVTRRE
jgi:hypothetical protein